MGAQKSILICDDDADLRELLKQVLEDSRPGAYNILEAQDGLQATHKVITQKFDCIVTDLKMPNREGGQLLQSIVKSEFNSKTPVVVITGYSAAELPKTSLDVSVIEKPIKNDLFLEILESKVLKKH